MPDIQIALGDALGRTLAQDISAQRDQPPFAAAAMDGYAVRASDSPRRLHLIGQSSAGAGFKGRVEEGQTVRIFTGAPLPQGSDSVVIQEDVIATGDQIDVPATCLGHHVRAQGIDFTAGTQLLTRGQMLDPIALALVAATGLDHLIVARRPKIAILTGGEEIVIPGGQLGPYQVFDSISTGLAALVQTWGADVITFAPRRDALSALEEGIRAAFLDADLVIAVGGASVGDHDLMKPALAAFKPHFRVNKIAMRPGKPLWFATTDLGPVLGLPGNPASALVCAYLFLAPVIAKMLSRPVIEDLPQARLARALPANGPREHYLRANGHTDATGQRWITPCEDQDSSLLSVFQSANALIQCAPNCPPLAAGHSVSFIDLARMV